MPSTEPKKVVGIVQARFSSSRLPGKMLESIEGKPMLQHVLSRAAQAKTLDELVLATTTHQSDDALVEFCAEKGFHCERGSEDDVLDRFYQVAQKQGADVVVRLTGDCPLLDPAVIDRVVQEYLDSSVDYAANNLVYSYPDGLDVEVFSFSALKQAWENAHLRSEREHVTPYLRNSGHFTTKSVMSGDPGLSPMRWTVDEPADLETIRGLYSKTTSRVGDAFGWRDVMETIRQTPELTQANQGIASNEGYYKSLLADPRVPTRSYSLEQSQALLARARAVIPSASQTFSKGPTQFVQGVAPTFLERGLGSKVWDVDGNEYLDYSMGLGPVILGHAYPRVNAAVSEQLEKGVSFSLPQKLEVEVAELLQSVIPCAQMVRYGKNGSDVTSGAVRVARAFTGRSKVACCGYHGWQDWYIGTTTRHRGVPEEVRDLTKTFNYNDLASLEAVLTANPGEFAAVILEPVTSVPPTPGFLEGVQKLARDHGALLIFDEIITGFRWGMGGAQEFFGVIPDLACFGKAMGNGFPIAVVTGRRDVMEVFDEIFFSFTFAGEAGALAAAKATILELKERDVFKFTWQQGKKIQDGINTLAKELGMQDTIRCVGYPCRSIVEFLGGDALLMKSYFQQECIKRGVLFVGFHNVSFSHSNADIELTLRVYLTAMENLKASLARGTLAQDIEGTPLSAVFRKV